MDCIKGKDLNLLLVFNALWQERHVTRAAKKIGVSQPALSRSLARLRIEFSDPLFVRSSNGVTPTSRAQELADTVSLGLASLNQAYSPQAKFSPATLNRVITIVCNDYFESIAASLILPRLFKEAPGITLNFRTGVGTIPKEGLEKGEVDLVVSGIYETLPDGFYRQKLLIDHYRSAVRRDHPLKSVSAEEFAQLSHVLVTPRGDLSGVVDQALLKIGKKRKVAVGSASFLSAALAVTETDFVFSAPGLLIERLKDLMQLRDFETPLTLPRLDIYQVWHARTQSDPALKWMRQRFLDWCKPRTDRTPGGSK